MWCQTITDDDDDATSAKDGLAAIGSAAKRVKYLKHADHPDDAFYQIGSNADPAVIGNLHELAEELGLPFSSRCWPTVLSTKPPDLRATMCPTPKAEGHRKRRKQKHAAINFTPKLKSKYVIKLSDYRKRYPQQPAAASAQGPSAGK